MRQSPDGSTFCAFRSASIACSGIKRWDQSSAPLSAANTPPQALHPLSHSAASLNVRRRYSTIFASHPQERRRGRSSDRIGCSAALMRPAPLRPVRRNPDPGPLSRRRLQHKGLRHLQVLRPLVHHFPLDVGVLHQAHSHRAPLGSLRMGVADVGLALQDKRIG